MAQGGRTDRAPRIRSERLAALLDAINGFGRDAATGGFDRPGFGAADMAARSWLQAEMGRRGLRARRDAAGNVVGRLGRADGPAVLAGSHVDTVPQGGAFDGALGVAVALECALALAEAGHVPDPALEVVAFAEEEGRFGGMLGSQAMAGAVDADWFAQARDAGGLLLTDALCAAGLDPAAIGSAARPAAEVAAFVELHVEQGPVLEAAGAALGLVTAISGCEVWEVTLEGIANHSGTTPMAMRADAFAGLAEAAAAIPDVIASEGGGQSRITIGQVALTPGAPHTIPGLAVFSVVLRDTDAAVMAALGAALRARIEHAAARHGLGFRIRQRSHLPPVALDAGLRAQLAKAAAEAGHGAMEMPSGAGHDAQTMQGLCPSALVFVPSRGGISHAPQEWTDWAHILAGAEVMLTALRRLTTPS